MDESFKKSSVWYGVDVSHPSSVVKSLKASNINPERKKHEKIKKSGLGKKLLTSRKRRQIKAGG